MKRILITVLTFTLMAGAAVAQNGNGPGAAPGNSNGGPGDGSCCADCTDPGARLMERLGLDEDQAADFESIMLQARERNQANMELAREEHCLIRADIDLQMSEVLTPEQFAEYQAIRAQRNERGARRGGRTGKGEPFGPGFDCPIDEEPANP